MNLINELREKSANAENKKNEVIAEIKTCFDKYLNSEQLENHIKRIIGPREINERKVFLMIEFWEYHSGCTTTNFNCAGAVWHNPENREGIQSWEYKGVELRTIDKEIGKYLSQRLINRMNELGFYVISQEYKPNRFNYYETHFYFGW